MIEKFTKDLLDKFIIQLNDDDNRKKLNNDILNPIFKEFSCKIYPYVSLLFIMYGLNLVLMIVTLVLIIMYLKKS